MGHAKGVKNKENLRAEAPPVWRVREGREVGTSVGGYQPTLSEMELGFPSDLREDDSGTEELFDGEGGFLRWRRRS